MSNIQVNDKVRKYKTALQSISSSLLGIANRFGANKDTRETLKEQIEHIQENFLFVIVKPVA